MSGPATLEGGAFGRPERLALRPGRGYAERKDEYLVRLRRIEGQVRGLERMVDEDQYCPNIVTQVAAATRALQEVAVGLLDDHIRSCAVAATKGSAANQAFDEVARTIRQVVRL